MNAVVPGENEHVVDPSKRWVPSPEAQLFPLPAESLSEESSTARDGRVVPEIKTSQRSSRLTLPPPSHDNVECPLAHRSRRLSFSYWKSRLGSCYTIVNDCCAWTDTYVIICDQIRRFEEPQEKGQRRR